MWFHYSTPTVSTLPKVQRMGFENSVKAKGTYHYPHTLNFVCFRRKVCMKCLFFFRWYNHQGGLDRLQDVLHSRRYRRHCYVQRGGGHISQRRLILWRDMPPHQCEVHTRASQNFSSRLNLADRGGPPFAKQFYYKEKAVGDFWVFKLAFWNCYQKCSWPFWL